MWAPSSDGTVTVDIQGISAPTHLMKGQILALGRAAEQSELAILPTSRSSDRHNRESVSQSTCTGTAYL